MVQPHPLPPEPSARAPHLRVAEPIDERTMQEPADVRDRGAAPEDDGLLGSVPLAPRPEVYPNEGEAPVHGFDEGVDPGLLPGRDGYDGPPSQALPEPVKGPWRNEVGFVQYEEGGKVDAIPSEEVHKSLQIQVLLQDDFPVHEAPLPGDGPDGFLSQVGLLDRLNHRKPAAVLLMHGDSGRRHIQAETAVVDFAKKRTGIRALDIDHQEKQVGDAGLREDLSTTTTSPGGPLRETWQVEKLDLGPSVGEDPRNRPEGREVVVADPTFGLGYEVQKRTLAHAWLPRDSHRRVASLPDPHPFLARPFRMLGLFAKLRELGSKTAYMFLG